MVLATISRDNNPHAIIVLSLGLIDEKLLIGACLMKATLKNIRNNNQVALVVKYNSEYYRLKGKAQIHSSGKYFNLAYKKSNPPMPKYAILIDIKEVFDLDKQKKII